MLRENNPLSAEQPADEKTISVLTKYYPKL